MRRPSALHALLAALAILAACSPPAEPPAAPSEPAPPAPVASASAAPLPPGPPVAPVRVVSDTYFGVTIADPYRWMEQSPPELTTWMKAQHDFTRSALDALPVRARLLARLEELDDEGDQMSSVTRAGGRTFYLRRGRGDEMAKLYVRDSPAGPERRLLDPGAMATTGGHLAIDEYTPSPDGRLCAYKLTAGGAEKGELRVLEIATGKELPDRIDRVPFGDVAWLDGKRFAYDRLRKLDPGAPQAEAFKGIVAFVHTLGEDAERDVPVLGAGVSRSLPVRDDTIPLVLALPGTHTLLGVLLDGVRPEKAYFVAPASGPLGPRTAWKKLADPDADQITWIESHGDDLYLLTHRDAPHFKVIKTSLAHPDLGHATVVVPESDLVLESIEVAEDALYASALERGIGRLVRVPHRAHGAHGEEAATRIELPVEGTLRHLTTDPGAPGASFELSSWALSPRIEAFDPKTGLVADTGLLAPSRADFSSVIAEETEAKSADGTKVPLSIIHLRTFTRDGSHPTWLRGYGAYGRSELPEFAPTLLAWLEQGGVYAVCHVRGGGEGGDTWHRDGMLLRKQHTIDDLIGCAEAMIEQKYTSPEHLAGEGASAGGIAIGGAITQRPELFGAALILVGVSNPLREAQSENVFNAPEFGSIATEDGFKALAIADAYSHVKDGARYPAVLLTTGESDQRVAPWQVTKMTARLQAATSSGKPVFLRVSYDGGHYNGATRQQRDGELADEYAFLLAQLGAAR